MLVVLDVSFLNLDEISVLLGVGCVVSKSGRDISDIGVGCVVCKSKRNVSDIGVGSVVS